MNEGLLTAFYKLPEWNEIQSHLNLGDCFSVSEIAEGERIFLAAALYQVSMRPVILVSSNEKTAQKQRQDIDRLFGLKTAFFPARDLHFSRAAMSRESTWQRIQTLSESKNTNILCMSIEAFLDRCPSPNLFRNESISLSEGESLGGPEKLIGRLLSIGYERVNLVEGKGQCAMRGSILDVFPSNGDNALRIEFFDDEVDSIRFFDCMSQRSVSRVKATRIYPATECLISDPEAAAERFKAALMEEPPDKAESPQDQEEMAFLSELDLLEEEEKTLQKAKQDTRESLKVLKTEREQTRQRHFQDAELIRAGQVIRTAPMWMNLLPEKTCMIASFFEKPILLLDCPNQFESRIRSAEREFEDSYREAERRGDAFIAQRGLRYTYGQLLREWKQYTRFIVSDADTPNEAFESMGTVSFGSVYSPTYQSQMRKLAEDVLKWKNQGQSVILLAGGEARGKRLQEVLSEEKVSCVYADALDGNLITREVVLLPVSFSKGFVHALAGLVVISDADIYGTAYQRSRVKKNASEKIASFTDLKQGDAVVHELHGIGIFRGIVQRTGSNSTRDYLLIEYAEGDKLYVPADQFDRIGKYIGSEQGMPKLNYLGGGEWIRQKNKVRSTLKELAFNLAELYAKRAKSTGYAFSSENPWQKEFDDRFPFELTEDQEKSVAEIEADMESPHNMDRLLCGDVGYGKTEVALRAAFKCVTEGKQVAMLAPTTILVQQHFNTIRKRFDGFPVHIDMLSRFRTPKEIKEITAKLKSGEIDFIVGTHKLLSKNIQFNDLGLLIVDEEQRFGVGHKETIQNMKSCVDVLTLSATPIPRTLHMSMVGIRDMSLLESPPEERLPVKTYVTEYSDSLIREAIRREMARGGQVYFLYNRVRTMEQMYSRIKMLVPDARIAIAHGQMQEKALEDIMLDFYAGAYDVLLCTTIVESGLDVPDANTLIVFDADHYGLSQLYQIRGRVGRSSRQAYAYFTVRKGKEVSETAQQRLNAIREFTEFGSGYRIAMRDLEIRGAGDVLGPQQSGHLCAVGYETYVKLIEEAVNEAQGKSVPVEMDTRVEISINAYMPEDYIIGENVRIEVYKRISMIQDEKTRLEVTDEIVDRFGEIPEPVENLIRIAELRGITRKLGISNINLRPDGLVMKFEPQYMPKMEKLMEAVFKTDSRLKFSTGIAPVLVLSQKNMKAVEAVEAGITLMGKVLADLDAAAEIPKAGAGNE